MHERISVDPQIHFGKPCVRGTRIPVHDVLALVREGIAYSKIVQDYFPDLTIADVQDCVQYAIDIVTLADIHLAANA